MSQVEQLYEKFQSDLKETLPKVHPKLTHEMVYFQKKLENDEILKRYKDEYKVPFVEFYINYDAKADLNKKIEELRKEKNLKATTSDKPNQVFVANRMSLDDMTSLTKDSDITEITGKASPIIRS